MNMIQNNDDFFFMKNVAFPDLERVDNQNDNPLYMILTNLRRFNMILC